MKQQQMRIRRSGFLFDTYEIYYREVERDFDGGKFIYWPESLVLTQSTPDETASIVREPLLQLDENVVQELMDELWTLGIRPKVLSAENDPQTISAMKHHINDLETGLAHSEITEKKLFEILDSNLGWLSAYIEEVSLNKAKK